MSRVHQVVTNWCSNFSKRDTPVERWTPGTSPGGHGGEKARQKPGVVKPRPRMAVDGCRFALHCNWYAKKTANRPRGFDAERPKKGPKNQVLRWPAGRSRDQTARVANIDATVVLDKLPPSEAAGYCSFSRSALISAGGSNRSGGNLTLCSTEVVVKTRC